MRWARGFVEEWLVVVVAGTRTSKDTSFLRLSWLFLLALLPLPERHELEQLLLSDQRNAMEVDGGQGSGKSERCRRDLLWSKGRRVPSRMVPF